MGGGDHFSEVPSCESKASYLLHKENSQMSDGLVTQNP